MVSGQYEYPAVPGASSARHFLSADISNCFPGVQLCSVCVHGALSAHEWSGEHGSQKPAAGTGEDRSAITWCRTTNRRVLHVLGAEPGLTARPASAARLGSSCSGRTPVRSPDLANSNGSTEERESEQTTVCA